MDIKEIKNVFVPYDSPIDAIFQRTIDSMASAFSKSMDDGVMTAVVKAGFNVDKEKLEQALTQDKCRYEGAYRNGYSDGYKKREDEIIRCRDCKYCEACDDEETAEPLIFDGLIWCELHEFSRKPDYFCGDAERKDGDGE